MFFSILPARRHTYPADWHNRKTKHDTAAAYGLPTPLHYWHFRPKQHRPSENFSDGLLPDGMPV
ncbi:hypothetical protein [Neisseria sp.]|uniref:hypothetical protein n=1 Tax=Neisseria sp. TaxID=192066 RepID=UPI00359F655D